MTTATKRKPLICTVEQARAFANGATQFRVPVKPQPTDETQAMRDVPGENRWWAATATCDELGTEYRPLGSDQQHEWHCPYPPGTVLAVKQPWADVNTDGGPAIAYRLGLNGEHDLHFCSDDAWPVEYERYPNCQFTMWIGDLIRNEPDHKWRAARTMPAWAVRTHLEVVSVRVQRVQDMTEDDARAEGVKAIPNSDGSLRWRDEFIRQWVAIRGLDWDSNPWMWVFEVKRVEGNQ